MFNSQAPDPGDLPTSEQLFKSTLLAIVIAAVVLLTLVLPAEFGKDPTGLGQWLGLKEMGRIKQSLAAEAAVEEGAEEMRRIPAVVPDAVIEEAPRADRTLESLRRDTLRFVLQPDEGKEIKVTLEEGQALYYSWTGGVSINFDAHADSKELGIKYHNYSKGAAPADSGSLVAAFTGNHGWFWRNRNSIPQMIVVELEGPYTELLRWP